MVELEGSESEIQTNYVLKVNLDYICKLDLSFVHSQSDCIVRGFSASL
jgi:hypothetical protein